MKKKKITTNGKLIIALSRSFQTIHRKSEQLFRQNGLTMAQFAVLEALLNKGDLTVGGLIEAALSTSGNMTVVIRNLEKLGHVHRAENPQDKRSFLISLTESGRTLVEGLFTQHMALVEESLSPITEEGLGASLQHYNPIIDDDVIQEFGVPAGWKLLAQMPFGVPSGQPTAIEYKPIEERLMVQKGGTK